MIDEVGDTVVKFVDAASLVVSFKTMGSGRKSEVNLIFKISISLIWPVRLKVTIVPKYSIVPMTTVTFL